MNTLIKRTFLALPLMAALFTTVSAVESPRAVVMDFGAVDTLKALGKESHIVAFPQGNLPQYLSDLPLKEAKNSGNLKEPDLAVITEVQPTLIVTSPRQGRVKEQLEAIAPVIEFGVNPDAYFESVSRNILALAKAMDAESAAKKALKVLEEMITHVRKIAKNSDKHALVMIHNDGNYIASNQSGYGKFIHNTLGVERADRDDSEERKTVNREYIELIQPDLVFVVDRSAAIGQTPMDQAQFRATVIQDVTLNNGNEIEFIYLDPTLWYLSGNGLESIAAQAKEVEEALIH